MYLHALIGHLDVLYVRRDVLRGGHHHELDGPAVLERLIRPLLDGADTCAKASAWHGWLFCRGRGDWEFAMPKYADFCCDDPGHQNWTTCQVKVSLGGVGGLIRKRSSLCRLMLLGGVIIWGLVLWEGQRDWTQQSCIVAKKQCTPLAQICTFPRVHLDPSTWKGLWTNPPKHWTTPHQT